MFGYCWKDVGLSSSRRVKLKEDLEENCEVIEIKPKKEKKIKARDSTETKQVRKNNGNRRRTRLGMEFFSLLPLNVGNSPPLVIDHFCLGLIVFVSQE